MTAKCARLMKKLSWKKIKNTACPSLSTALLCATALRSALPILWETALKLAEGLVEINVIGGETQMYSENFACSDCGISLPEIEPRLFSFNNPMGACPACTGLGMNMELDKSLIIPDGSKTFAEGVIAALSTNQEAYHMKQLAAVLSYYGYSLDTVWNDLPKDMQEILWYGSGEQKIFVYV